MVWRRLGGEPPRPGTNDLIVWQLRVPRALLAALVGAGLGLVGTAVQALVRNPLADPYLLGISNGASLGRGRRHRARRWERAARWGWACPGPRSPEPWPLSRWCG